MRTSINDTGSLREYGMRFAIDHREVNTPILVSRRSRGQRAVDNTSRQFNCFTVKPEVDWNDIMLPVNDRPRVLV